MSGWLVAGIASLVAGFVSALGLGGGGILVLYLTLFLGMEQMQAGGINLIFFLPLAAVSIYIHMKHRLIDYKFALKCAPSGVVGAFLGVWLANALHPVWVSKGFAVFVLILGIRELFSKGKKEEDGPDKK